VTDFYLLYRLEMKKHTGKYLPVFLRFQFLQVV
jgi:hypothetical protein